MGGSLFVGVAIRSTEPEDWTVFVRVVCDTLRRVRCVGVGHGVGIVCARGCCVMCRSCEYCSVRAVMHCVLTIRRCA
jgi:hypothetical protein